MLCISVFYFLLIHPIPLSGYTIICLYIHLLMGICVVSILGLLQIKLLNICEQVFV